MPTTIDEAVYMVLIGAVPFCADIALVLCTLYSPSLESAIGCGKNTYTPL